MRSSIAGVELILNFDNGSVVGLTEAGADVVDRLSKGEIDLASAKEKEPVLLAYLERANYFVEDSGVIKPLSVYYHVTQRCNLACVGCYSEDEYRNCTPDVAYDMICGGLDKLKTLPVESLVISGGEPFLRQDIPDILRYAKCHCGIPKVRVITNGLVVGEDVINRVAPYVDEIAVSFDGFSEKGHSWIRGEQNFKKLSSLVQTIKQAGIQPHVISTIHAKNIDDIEECRQFAGKLDVPYHYSLFSCDASRPNAKEFAFDRSSLAALCDKMLSVKTKEGKASLDLVSSIQAKKKCGCGISNLSVGHDGSIYPCHMLHYGRYSMGNLYSDFENAKDLRDAIQGMEICGLSVDEIEGCKDCEFRYICGGGCRARSCFATGAFDKKDPYCEFMKQYYEKVFIGLSD